MKNSGLVIMNKHFFDCRYNAQYNSRLGKVSDSNGLKTRLPATHSPLDHGSVIAIIIRMLKDLLFVTPTCVKYK
jgi:hypothetical protein